MIISLPPRPPPGQAAALRPRAEAVPGRRVAGARARLRGGVRRRVHARGAGQGADEHRGGAVRGGMGYRDAIWGVSKTFSVDYYNASRLEAH